MAYYRVRFRRQQVKVNLCAVSSTTYFVWKSVTYSLLARWHSLSNLNVFGVAKFWLLLFKLFVILPTTFLRKKVWFARTPQCIQILVFAQGFSHPFEAAEIFSDSLHLSLSNHGMGTESFVCLSRLFWFFFCVFVFLSNYGVTKFWLSANKFSIGQPLLPRAGDTPDPKDRWAFHQHPN